MYQPLNDSSTFSEGMGYIKIILDNLFAYVALLDVDAVVLEVNSAPLKRGRYLHDEVVGQRFYDAPWWSYDSAVRARLIDALNQVREGKSCRYDEIIKMGDELITIDFQVSPIFSKDNEVIGMVPTATDITKRKVIEEQLATKEEQYRFVLDGSELGFWDWNIPKNEVERNKRWAEMLGYTHDEIKNTTQQWTDFIYPDDRENAWQSIKSVIEGASDLHRMEYRMLHKSGSIVWILDQAKVMKRDASGNPIRMCGTHTDITGLKLLQLELEKQAHTDYLTGVNNRRFFIEKAELEIGRSDRYGSSLSLLMIDIDNFKSVNDKYGHKSGDIVLQEFAKLCQQNLREIDILGRIGGEEFAALLPETSLVDAVDAAERLRNSVQNHHIVIADGTKITFTVSIGIACKSDRLMSLDSILIEADNHLYVAKTTGRNRYAFTSSQPK